MNPTPPDHPALDTHRSDARVRDLADRDFVARRRVITFTRTVAAPREAVFPQLCPTREHDWIDGWNAELVYSESGYGEDRCVFRTGEDNATGPGLWTFSHVDAPGLLKIVRVMPPFLQHLRVDLIDNGDGSCDTRWTVTVTALDARGNALLEALPDDDESFAGSADALVHYFATGSMRAREDGGADHGLLAAAARHRREG